MALLRRMSSALRVFQSKKILERRQLLGIGRGTDKLLEPFDIRLRYIFLHGGGLG